MKFAKTTMENSGSGDLQSEVQRVTGNFEQGRYENSQNAQNLVSYYVCLLEPFKTLLWNAVEQIGHFTNLQRYAVYARPVQNGNQILENVQNCFSKILHCLSTIADDILNLRYIQTPEPVELNSLSNEVDTMINFIFSNCFIVLEQPL